jgi:hypothetical protein
MAEHLPLYANHPDDTGHKPQSEFLNYARGRADRHDGSIQFQAFISGRGGGKTAIAIIDLALVALIEAPNAATLWTSRTTGEIESVFIPELRKLVPEKYFHYHKDNTNKRIKWITGHTTHLRSRNVDNPGRRVTLGMTVCGLYIDEAATQYDHDKITDIINTVRGKHFPFLFVVAISTPLPNAFRNFYNAVNCHTTKSTSYDNPHLSKKNVESMESQLDELTARQEIYGEDVITTGRMWDTFEERAWPEGNVLEGYQFDHSKPFFLGVDLGGSQSAIQLYQYTDPRHPITGNLVYKSGVRLCVMVAEWLPNRTGIEVVIDDIVQRYCNGNHLERKPALTSIGHDVNASTVTGASGAEVFQKLGWKYDFPRGASSRKAVQRQVARGLILNTQNERRFVIAAEKDSNGIYQTIKHMGKNQTRGLLDVMRLDTYPDDDNVFNKDKKKLKTGALEDARDSWLYHLVNNHPPTFNISTLLSK